MACAGPVRIKRKEEIKIILDVLKDAALDSLKMLPFLFAAFLLLETVEHHAGQKINRALSASGKAGPVLGVALGCVPQCGFSVLAANLYSGGIITLGTLLAVFLSTSDEAIILLFSQPQKGKSILLLLLTKVIIGVTFGYLIDLILRRHPLQKKKNVAELCDEEHCHCHEHKGILYPAFLHTVKIFFFILLFTILLNFALTFLGTERLAALLLRDTFFQPVLAALIGLIPNCAASVLLAELYLNGALSFASVVAGLCSGAGIGLVVLFRANKSIKENLAITGILFAIASLSGILLELLTKIIA